MWRRFGFLMLVSCACATHDGPDAGADATDDAHDAAHDTAEHDSSIPDADAPPLDGFVRVSGSFPAAAELSIANPDLLAATSFPIETCPDRAGCRRIVQTWPSGACTGRPLACSPFAVAEASGDHDGTRGAIIIMRQNSLSYVETWAIDDTGQALAGFRSATLPAPSARGVDIHGGSIALAMYGGMVGGDELEFLLVAPFDNPFSFIDLGEVDHVTPGMDVMQRAQLGDGAIAGEMTSLAVQRVPLDGSAPTVVTADEGTLGAIAGETIFFDHYAGGPAQVQVARAGEPSEPLILGPRTNSYRIATDGRDLVWLEYDYDAMGMATNYEVWTSPYAERTTGLAARRLDTPALISATSAITVGFGAAAVDDGLGGLRLYRLADGYHADLAPSTGEYWMSPAYIGPTELAVAGETHGLVTTQLCFIELASLAWVPSS